MSKIDLYVLAVPGSRVNREYVLHEDHLAAVAEAVEKRDKRLLVKTQFAGIFAEFTDIEDAIGQMSLHIRELEERIRDELANNKKGPELAPRTPQARGEV